MHGFVPMIIPIPIWGGSSAPESTVTITTHTSLSLHVLNLVKTEKSVVSELGLGAAQRWIYPFAVFKLALAAKKDSGERKSGPLEAVIWWVQIRRCNDGSRQIQIEAILKVADARYGPLDKLPR